MGQQGGAAWVGARGLGMPGLPDRGARRLVLETDGSRDSPPHSGGSASSCLAGHGEALPGPGLPLLVILPYPNDLVIQSSSRAGAPGPSSHKPGSPRACVGQTGLTRGSGVACLPLRPGLLIRARSLPNRSSQSQLKIPRREQRHPLPPSLYSAWLGGVQTVVPKTAAPLPTHPPASPARSPLRKL